MLLTGLIFISVVLTCTMFATKQAMLGFACAIMWALTGGEAYILSTATWDIYFLLAFASLLGMTTLTIFGAFGLREKRDTIADEELEEGEGELIGEQHKDDGSEPKVKTRREALHERAKRRREGEIQRRRL